MIIIFWVVRFLIPIVISCIYSSSRSKTGHLSVPQPHGPASDNPRHVSSTRPKHTGHTGYRDSSTATVVNMRSENWCSSDTLVVNIFQFQISSCSHYSYYHIPTCIWYTWMRVCYIHALSNLLFCMALAGHPTSLSIKLHHPPPPHLFFLYPLMQHLEIRKDILMCYCSI